MSMDDQRDIEFKTTKTAKISGKGQLTGSTLKEFANSVPDFSTIKLVESKYTRDGPFGYANPWEITATWNE